MFFVELPNSFILFAKFKPKIFLYTPSEHNTCSKTGRISSLYDELPFTDGSLQRLHNIGILDACATFYVHKGASPCVVVESCEPIDRIFSQYSAALLLATAACFTNLEVIHYTPAHFGLLQQARSISKEKHYFDYIIKNDRKTLVLSALNSMVNLPRANSTYSVSSEMVPINWFPSRPTRPKWWKHGVEVLKSRDDKEATRKVEKYLSKK